MPCRMLQKPLAPVYLLTDASIFTPYSNFISRAPTVTTDFLLLRFYAEGIPKIQSNANHQIDNTFPDQTNV